MTHTDAVKLADRLRNEAFDSLSGHVPIMLEAAAALYALRAQPDLTIKPNSQDWKGMDGAVAFHLIERHSDNWADARLMMDEWREANSQSDALLDEAKRIQALFMGALGEVLRDNGFNDHDVATIRGEVVSRIEARNG